MKTKRFKKSDVVAFLINAELILTSILVIVPVIWIVSSSFNNGTSLITSGFLPKSFTLDNYRRLFHETSYIVWFCNTFEIAILNMIVSVSLIMISAWTVSRFYFKWKKAGMLTMLVLSMFPTFLSMTAMYTLFVTLGLIGKPIALVMIYTGGAIPYNVWLVKGYLDGISKELDEAAYVDGCSRIKSFFLIVLPLSKPIIVYCAVSQFMMPWMDYILPNLLLSGDDNKTVAVGLYSLIHGHENLYFTTFAAGAVIVAIPITVIYLLFQKFLVQGISAGANKG
ncbi:MAG: sugar ABC transporter permease [Lachnospiraceae bacterium]|nr:sugar ABC transporter permease [Lachnospiraceae bacterium]